MVVQNSEALALLGYIIVTNEEMHSYQIRYLNSFLEKEGLIDYKCQIYGSIVIRDSRFVNEFHILKATCKFCTRLSTFVMTFPFFPLLL